MRVSPLGWLATTLVGCLVAACQAATPRLPDTPQGDDVKAMSTEALAERFRAFREELGRPDAPPEYRHWAGPVHAVMAELGQRVADSQVDVSELLSLCGAPDQTLRGGERHHGLSVPDNETLLIYHWRGGHDYLYFVVVDDRVAAAEWWLAGE